MISLKHILEGVEYGDTLIEIYLAVLYECNEPQLSGKTVLTREFAGLNKAAAKVTTETDKPYGTKNALGLMAKPEIKNLFDIIKDKYGLATFIYCSHGKSKFGLSGRSYIVVPKNPFKTIWSPQVSDIYADASRMIKDQGNLDAFPIDSYTDSWPSGNVSEVILDCEYYFLINENYDLIAESKHHTGISNIQTYDQLATVLNDVLTRPDDRGKTYKDKYTTYDWSGIDTPADPDM